MGFLLLVIVGAAAMYFYFYVKGPGGKPFIQEEFDALKQAHEVKTMQDKHNQDIDAALQED